jgi:hypothetical protein
MYRVNDRLIPALDWAKKISARNKQSDNYCKDCGQKSHLEICMPCQKIQSGV